jgi:hypothetical protein
MINRGIASLVFEKLEKGCETNGAVPANGAQHQGQGMKVIHLVHHCRTGTKTFDTVYELMES